MAHLPVGQVHVVGDEAQVELAGGVLKLQAVALLVYAARNGGAVKLSDGVVVAQAAALVGAQPLAIDLPSLTVLLFRLFCLFPSNALCAAMTRGMRGTSSADNPPPGVGMLQPGRDSCEA